MKVPAVLSALTAFAASFVSASTFSTLSVDQLTRFALERAQLAEELVAWKNSEYGLYAKQNGLYPEAIQSTVGAEYSQTELERFFISKLNIEKVSAENPEATFSMETPFAMMTEEEFKQYVGRSFSNGEGLQGTLEAPETTSERASTRDWTTSGCLPPVKSQGSCGSCWAFSAVGALEAGWCLHNNNELTLLSEQQVTSCDTTCDGCQGGWMSNALDYVTKNGICESSAYPYTSGSWGSTGSCKASSCQKVNMPIKGYVNVPFSEEGFLNSIDVQPISVALSAGNSAWRYYKGGVVSSCSGELDHGVVAVGYGADAKGVEYFKLRNSWGARWGDKGYIYLKRGAENNGTCGVINDYAVYPAFE